MDPVDPDSDPQHCLEQEQEQGEVPLPQRTRRLQQQVDDRQVVVLHHRLPIHVKPSHVRHVQETETSIFSR